MKLWCAPLLAITLAISGCNRRYEASFVVGLGKTSDQPASFSGHHIGHGVDAHTYALMLKSNTLWTQQIAPRLRLPERDWTEIRQGLSISSLALRNFRQFHTYQFTISLRRGSENEFDAISDGFIAAMIAQAEARKSDYAESLQKMRAELGAENNPERSTALKGRIQAMEHSLQLDCVELFSKQKPADDRTRNH